MATVTVQTSSIKRRISPRTMLKCQSERVRKAKLISKSLFGTSNKTELKERIKAASTNIQQPTTKWEFDFETGKPTKIHKNFKWEAICSHEVPNVYTVNHIKRLYSMNDNVGFEGQLPKLRYYHHLKSREVNNNDVVLKGQPITVSKKNAGQTKITDFLKEKKRLSVSGKKKHQHQRV